MKNVTIYDVAKCVGCSTATVSLALANDKRIQAKTVKRVMEAVEKLGYTPNYTAKSLSKKKTNTLGLLVPNVENPLFSMMISGIENYANSNNYDLILGISNSNQEKELFYLEMLQSKRVDGLIIFPTFMNSIAKRLSVSNNMPPIVLCGSSGTKAKNINYVKCDNKMGAFLAVQHLIECGSKRIACIFPADDPTQYNSRYKGYCEALNKNNIPVDKDLLCVCQPNVESIFNATTALINDKKPDAIFCLCDYHAVIVSHAIDKLGLKMPTDIKLVGFDNINISSFLSTPLSTIDTQGEKVGRIAAEILIDKIDNPNTPVKQIITEPLLVVRNSTKFK